MDEFELIREFDDRHAAYLVYEGSYLLKAQGLDESLKTLFKDWRQRVYRFDNNAGASVVLYRPISRPVMTWDLILASFFGDNPLDFSYKNRLLSNLCWQEVQGLLDKIKANRF